MTVFTTLFLSFIITLACADDRVVDVCTNVTYRTDPRCYTEALDHRGVYDILIGCCIVVGVIGIVSVWQHQRSPRGMYSSDGNESKDAKASGASPPLSSTSAIVSTSNTW
eukprot:PhF_6_TR43779/c0_g2_i1/m.67154